VAIVGIMPLEYQTPQDIIRNFNEEGNVKQWGFVIYRCTYKSQEKWETFISLIKEDARECLEGHGDLWETLNWTIFEDPAMDGVDYAEPSQRFGEWVETEGSEEIKGSVSTEEQQRFRRMQPRYNFFLYVNEEALDSVVDAAEANDRGRPNGYYVTVVRQDSIVERLAKKERLARKAAGEELPDDEMEGDLDDFEEDEEEEDYKRHFRQRIKAWDIVPMYAGTIEGHHWWYFFTDRDGIIENLG
jgi:hypothetical protein